jgi:hypothetical protein
MSGVHPQFIDEAFHVQNTSIAWKFAVIKTVVNDLRVVHSSAD